MVLSVVRNYRGRLSVPSDLPLLIATPMTRVFDVGTTPVLRWGNAHFILNPGIAFTLRRDTETPAPLNQEPVPAISLFDQLIHFPVDHHSRQRRSRIRAIQRTESQLSRSWRYAWNLKSVVHGDIIRW